MQASQIPTKFQIPWGNSAGGSYIRSVPVASQIGITNGAASLTDGFPPLNFLPLGAGGVPPFGQDMNGILNQITAWVRWQNAGAPVQYDVAFSTAVGGYPIGSLLSSTSTLGYYWLCLVDNNTSDPDAGGAGWRAVFLQSVLTTNTNYYVNASTGSDSNNGLTSGTAFATIQKALTTVSQFNLNGFNVTINVANGTYAPASAPAINGSGAVTLLGNSGAPSNVIVHATAGSALSFGGAGSYVVNGFTLQSDAPSGSDSGYGIVSLTTGSIVTVQNCNFNQCYAAHIHASQGGFISLTGNITHAGGVTTFGCYFATSGGQIASLSASLPAIIISTAIGVPNFVVATYLGITHIHYASLTNPGNVTGTRYDVSSNAVIESSGGANYYPGTVAGSASTGGQYI